MLFTNFLKPVPKKLHSYKIFISVDCSVSARSLVFSIFKFCFFYFGYWILINIYWVNYHTFGGQSWMLSKVCLLSLTGVLWNFFSLLLLVYICVSKLIEQIFCWIDLACQSVFYQSNPLNRKTNFLIKPLKCITNVS